MELVNATMTSAQATSLSSPSASTAASTSAAAATAAASTSVATAIVGAAKSSSSPSLSSYTTVVATTISNITSSLLPSELTTNATPTLHTSTYNRTVETITQPSLPENVSRSSNWNLTRVSEALPKAATSASVSLCTPTMSSTSTENPFDEFGPPEGIEYIFVPLGVMIFVIVLSAVVIIISRKRKLERLRHRLMPLYNFDPGEEGEDDWETELLDEGFSSRQRRVSNSIAT